MKLEDLRGWMGGEDCVVVGCGPSCGNGELLDVLVVDGGYARTDTTYRKHWTIACNRSAGYWPPDFAVCVEPFRDKTLWGIMREASPLIVFSHICEDRKGNKPHPRIVQVGSKNVKDWMTDEDLGDEPLTLNQSPFIAAAVAAFLGFETIGLIGVDLTEDRYPDVTRINKAWARLESVIHLGMGSRLVNLNPESRLTTVPMGEWGEVRGK